MQARLKTFYDNEIKKALIKKFNYSNVMRVPKLEKIVLNVGDGKMAQDKGRVKGAHDALMVIAGQKPVVTYAKNSIAGFKLREDSPIGVKVTLRKARMYEFLDRLINIAMPRIRDFRGLSLKSFDGRGNYSMGIKEQIIFPEVDYDKLDTIRGMDLCFVTSANTNEEALELLKGFNMPFKKPAGKNTAA